MMSITVPIRTVSEANAHEHWRARQRRAKEQRTFTAMACRSGMRFDARAFRVTTATMTVRLVRVAPGTLDSDNLAGSQKHVRDGIADWLGIDDGSPRITWEYAQEHGPKGFYGVRIEVIPLEPGLAKESA